MLKGLYLLLLLSLLVSCHTRESDQIVSNKVGDTLTADVKRSSESTLIDSTSQANLIIVSLKNRPSPLSIAVPFRVGNSLNLQTNDGPKRIQLLPPPSKEAGFLAHFKTYTTDQGLALDPLFCSLRDHEGNLWFGTDGGGVSRYDGNTFLNFNTSHGMSNNVVESIMEDHLGNLWFGTDGGGVSRYNGVQFTSLTTDVGIASNSVLSLLEDKAGNIWMGTMGGGISCLKAEYIQMPCISGHCMHDLSNKTELNAHHLEIRKGIINFNTKSGLAGNIVWSVLEDKDAYLWFGTADGGVSRFKPSNPVNSNDRAFDNFTTSQGLANNRVNCIKEDHKGNLWFGTSGGGVSIFKQKRRLNACYQHTCEHRMGIPAEKSSHDREISKYITNVSIAQGLPGNVIYNIHEDVDQNIWLATGGNGVVRCAVDQMEIFESGSGNIKRDLKIQNQDPKDLNSEAFTVLSTVQGLANNFVYSIAEDKMHNLWFSTYGGGVTCYFGKAFTNITEAQGLSNNIVYSITQDRNGQHWFGTYGGGVTRYDGERFTTFSLSQGLSNDVIYCITEDRQGNLWMGTNNEGVCRFDGKQFTNIRTTHGLAHNNVRCISEDKQGDLWMGTWGGGLSRFSNQENLLHSTFTNFTTQQGLPSNVICDIEEDHNGNLWIGTYGGGLSFLDHKSLDLPCFKGACRHNQKIVSEFNEHNDIVSRGFVSLNKQSGLADLNVRCIRQDNSGNLWLGTSAGISYLSAIAVNQLAKDISVMTNVSNESGRAIYLKPVFQHLTMQNGLPDNFVTQLSEAKDGLMIAGTNLGIAFFRGETDSKGQLTGITDVQVYNSPKGYPVKDVNAGQDCLFADRDGVLWIGTGSDKTALVRLDLKELKISNEPPTLKIQQVKINNESVSWYDFATEKLKIQLPDSGAKGMHQLLAYGKLIPDAQLKSLRSNLSGIRFDSISPHNSIPYNLILPYDRNHISFNFNAIEPGRPFLLKYMHRLVGYDDQWSPASSDNHVSFGNMFEGDYTFMVKAQGANGVWSNPVLYHFKVLPPLYRSWWAYLMYGLILVALIKLWSAWYERKLIREKDTLEATVEERTQEVVNEKLEVERQKERSDELLLNILPEEVAEELKLTGTAAARSFDQVTVMFTDFKNFTKISEKLSPSELVAEIHTCFKAFDEIITSHNIEKIKTIGDGYMCAGGLPVENKSHAVDMVNAALDIQEFMKEHVKKSVLGTYGGVRIGIHSGPVVAGIVGVKKFAYDIWGDTVNIASRMESSGETGKINISVDTYELVKDQFECTYRGKMHAKHKEDIEMYFVDHIRSKA